MRAPATRYTFLVPILGQPSSSSWTRTRFRKSTEAHSHSPSRMSLSSMTLHAIFSALIRFLVGQLCLWMARLSDPRVSQSNQQAFKMHIIEGLASFLHLSHKAFTTTATLALPKYGRINKRIISRLEDTCWTDNDMHRCTRLRMTGISYNFVTSLLQIEF